jgi:hypothetical protein
MGHFERTFAAKTSWWAEERGRCSSWPRGYSYQLPLAGPVPTCQEIDESSIKLQRKGAIEKLLIQMQFCAKMGKGPRLSLAPNRFTPPALCMASADLLRV